MTSEIRSIYSIQQFWRAIRLREEFTRSSSSPVDCELFLPLLFLSIFRTQRCTGDSGLSSLGPSTSFVETRHLDLPFLQKFSDSHRDTPGSEGERTPLSDWRDAGLLATCDTRALNSQRLSRRACCVETVARAHARLRAVRYSSAG